MIRVNIGALTARRQDTPEIHVGISMENLNRHRIWVRSQHLIRARNQVSRIGKKYNSANMASLETSPLVTQERHPSSNPKEEIINSFRDHLELYGRTLHLMDSGPTPSTSYMSTLDNAATAFYVSSHTIDSPWVIDFGASNHMTDKSNLFQTYNLLFGRDKVRLANGSFSTIAGQGTLPLPLGLTLSNVLQVSKLPINLLSISSITHSLNCSVTFFPSSYVFQDLALGKTIGRGSMVDGLYVLENKASLVATES